MKLNIFWRMITSYLVIVLFVIVLGSYSILKWNQLNKVTNSFLTIDQPTIDTEKKMIDSLLSQHRNEQKYIITGDDAFYNLFRTHKSEFVDNLSQLDSLLDTPEEIELKNAVDKSYSHYNLLLNKEMKAMKRIKLSSENQYAKEINELVDRLTGNLDELIVMGQVKINRKMEYLKKTGGRAALTAGGLAFVSIMLGIILASFITGSINRPLKKLEAITKHIAEGDFDSKIEVETPAELAVLAQSFNRMSDKLREIDEMKSGFISHISHELRTPLTSMNEANSLLLDKVAGKLTRKQIHLLEIIKDGNSKLINLINELLDLSKMEAGMMDYQLTRAEISPLIDRCVEDIKLLTDKKNIQIQCSVEEYLPSVPMDVDKIQHVLNNLLSNAAKFTPEKGVIKVMAGLSLSENLKPGGTDNGYIRVSVSNTGACIPQEYLTKIFDKFQQIESESSGPIKGTGLGLSIAKHIVEAHDGQIWAESGIENGSVFSFLLPLDGE